MPSRLTRPLGGTLVNLVAFSARANDLRQASMGWASWHLTPRQLCDLELLATGGYSPLRGFMGWADYDSVVTSLRLTDGTLWPVPVVLDLPAALADQVQVGGPLALRDPEGVLLAGLHIEETWPLDPSGLPGHIGVAGRLEVVQPPVHYDFADLRRTPAQLRQVLEARNVSNVVSLPTQDVLTRPAIALLQQATEQLHAQALVHAEVAPTGPGDEAHYTRVRCLRAALAGTGSSTMLALLPFADRPPGLPATLLQAIVAQNFGVSHVLLPPVDRLEKFADELKVTVLPVPPLPVLPPRELQRRLELGEPLPEDLVLPAVAEELRRAYPPRAQQGVTVFFTGLSGSGKSTIANVLRVRLLERGSRRVTLLDGDLVRRHLSSELGFSHEHRDVNVRRIGFVAAEITKNGGVAVCAPIAPYDATRRQVRAMVEEGGGFVLVHVATDLTTCEARDRKGLYAKARAGLLPEFTGISDPYEEPHDADVVVDTRTESPEEAAGRVLAHLEAEGYLHRAAYGDRVPSSGPTDKAGRILAVGGEIAPLLSEPWRSEDHGDLLYDEEGLPG